VSKAKKSSVVPEDVVWDADREVISYTIVPCRPTGYRIVERRSSLEEAIVFGTISDRDDGALQIERCATRLANQARKE
jgi:hypothetical protein